MENEPKCLFCNQTSDQAPLVNLTYQGKALWICSTHLPILIHEPHKLADQMAKAVEEANKK